MLAYLVSNPGVYPVAADDWLAHLYLARVLVLQHNPAAVRPKYRKFLSGCNPADPDTPLMQAAKAEFAEL